MKSHAYFTVQKYYVGGTLLPANSISMNNIFRRGGGYCRQVRLRGALQFITFPSSSPIYFIFAFPAVLGGKAMIMETDAKRVGEGPSPGQKRMRMRMRMKINIPAHIYMNTHVPKEHRLI